MDFKEVTENITEEIVLKKLEFLLEKKSIKEIEKESTALRIKKKNIKDKETIKTELDVKIKRKFVTKVKINKIFQGL